MMPTLDMEMQVMWKILYVNGCKEGDCGLLIYCVVTMGLGLELLEFLLQFVATLGYQ